MPLRRVVVVIVLAGLGGCVDFPREEVIEDLRVLAVRTEPAEVLYSSLYLLPEEERPSSLPSVILNVEVFAFDPRGGLVTERLHLCPSVEEPVGIDTGGTVPVEVTSPIAGDGADPDGALCSPAPDAEGPFGPLEQEVFVEPTGLDPLGRIPGLIHSLALGPDVMERLVPNAAASPLLAYAPAQPRLVLSLDNGSMAGPPALALKRVPFSLDIVDAILHGVSLEGLIADPPLGVCDLSDEKDLAPGRARCLLLRLPNANPPLVGFQRYEDIPPAGVATVEPGSEDLPLGETLVVAPGEALNLAPAFLEGALELYQTLIFEPERERFRLYTVLEDPVASYYVTSGSLRVQDASLTLHQNLGTVWTLPSSRRAGERDALVVVVRDQRGGTAVGQLTVVYAP